MVPVRSTSDAGPRTYSCRAAVFRLNADQQRPMYLETTPSAVGNVSTALPARWSAQRQAIFLVASMHTNESVASMRQRNGARRGISTPTSGITVSDGGTQHLSARDFPAATTHSVSTPTRSVSSRQPSPNSPSSSDHGIHRSSACSHSAVQALAVRVS